MQNETNSNNKSGMEKYFFRASAEDFKKIPGSPIAYWIKKKEVVCFESGDIVDSFCEPRKGMDTGENSIFLRQWYEINRNYFSEIANKKWFPYNKGGDYRKWYGNREYVVLWENNGQVIRSRIDNIINKPTLRNTNYYFKEGFTWTTISSSSFSIRYSPSGAIFDNGGCTLFSNKYLHLAGGLLCSNIAKRYLSILSPTLNFQPGDIGKVPFIIPSLPSKDLIESNVSILICSHKLDWDAFETSWDFQALPWLPSVLPDYLKDTGIAAPDRHSLASCWDTWRAVGQHWTSEMLRLEEENNRLFIDAYGLQDELTPDVPIEQITLTVNPWYRYGRKAARGEGRGASEEGDFDGSELQRADSLAKSNADGSGDIQSDSNISQGRVVRVNESIKTGGSIGSVEHSRGEFSQHQGGIQTISGNRTGITGRDRDSITTVPAVGLSESNDLGSDPTYSNRSQQNDQCPPQKDGITSPLAPRPSSLTTPYLESLMRKDGARELVSYAIGCAMGRYSLDARGLIYAEAGGQGFDSAQYPTFPADDDGILPITDLRWFDEDGADRVETFVRTVWGEERHDENITWLANGLGVKGNESPDETLRRYLAGDFYKDHLQTYKKRPIYWKFSSGKEKAFEALVYLHRYNKGTLSRMRMQFVVPLSGKIRGQMGLVEQQIAGASSTAEQKRLTKLKAGLHTKLAELTAFDNELNHYAQMQIELDLDDGVRVNYGKFGGLLANVKDVVGKKEE